MVGKLIHVDDGRRDPQILAISCEVRAWVKKHLMPLVGEECGGGHKQTSITIAGRTGVVNVPLWGPGSLGEA
jgi:hypothetical protein